MVQLKEILMAFWEDEHCEKEEEVQVRKNRKRDRKLRNLPSSVNYDRNVDLEARMEISGLS